MHGRHTGGARRPRNDRSDDELRTRGEALVKSGCGTYLLGLLEEER